MSGQPEGLAHVAKVEAGFLAGARAEVRIADVEVASPATVRLAEAVSLAVIVDPPLLRRARLVLVPEADAGTEMDLWLSPLVHLRSPEGIVFAPGIAEALRQRLRTDPERLARARTLTDELHQHLSPAVRLEEEIAWLSVSPEPAAAARIEALLRSVLAALVAGERRGLARWAARALPMLPSGVRASSTVRMLEAGARLRLGGDAGGLRALAERGGMPDWAAWVAPADLPRVEVRVRLCDGAIEIDGAPDASGNRLELPATEPLLVDLTWLDAAGEPGGAQVTLRRGEARRVPVPAGPIRLRTVLGEMYDLRAAGQAARGWRERIFDFSAERERHRPFFGQEELLKRIEQALFGGSSTKSRMVVIWGPPGAGKTALLGHLLDQREAAGRPTAYHFFQRGRQSADLDAAERSLLAQIVARFPEIEHLAAIAGLTETVRQLKSLGNGGQALIVLDGLDQLEAQDPAELERWLWSVANGVNVLVSARAGNRREIAWAFAGEGDQASMIEIAPTPGALELYWSHYAGALGVDPQWLARAVQLSGSNFAQASLLNAWSQEERRESALNQPLAVPDDVDLIEFLLRAVEEKLGRRESERLLQVLVAARGPLPVTVLRLIVDFDSLEKHPIFAMRRVSASGEPTYELREEILRYRLGFQRRSSFNPDHAIADAVSSTWRRRDASPALREYAVRHAVFHWLAPPGAAIGLDPAHELLTDPAYLTQKVRVQPIDAVRNELQAWIAARKAAGASVHDGRAISAILNALTEIGPELQRRAAEIAAMLCSRLPSERPELERFRKFLGTPPGAPMLLLRVGWGSGKDTLALASTLRARHRGPIVGCALTELPAAAPAGTRAAGESITTRRSRQVLSWSADGTLKTWDSMTGRHLATLYGHQGEVTACVLLRGGRAVSSARDCTLRVWDLNSGQALSTLYGHGGEILGITTIALAKPSGLGLVSWSADHTLRTWSVEDLPTEVVCRPIATFSGHQGAVTACATAPDGQYLISGSDDSTLRVWDVASGKTVCVLRGHTAAVTGIAVLHGATLAVSCSHDRTLKVWSLVGPFGSQAGGGAEPEVRDPLLSETGHTLGVLGCALSGDGSQLATWSLDRTASIWDVGALARSEVPSVPIPSRRLTGHQGAVLGAAFVPLSDQLATCSADRTVRLWSARTGECLGICEGHEREVRAVTAGAASLPAAHDAAAMAGLNGLDDVSRESAMLIFSGSDDRILRIWRATEGSPAVALCGEADEIVACLAAPDHESILTVTRAGRHRLHSRSGTSTELGSRGGLTVRGASIGPHGFGASWHWDADLRRSEIDVWGLGSGFLQCTYFGHDGPVLACAFDPFFELLLSASADHTISIWRIIKAPPRPIAVLSGHRGPVADVKVSPQGGVALSASWDGTLRLWSLGLDPQTLAIFSSHSDRALACAISSDGRFGVSASADRTLRTWDLEGRRPLAVLAGHAADVTGCAFTRNGRRIVSRSLDCTLRLWDAASGAQITTLEGHTDQIHSFALDEDIGLVFSCSEDGTVRGWDLATGDPRGIFYASSPMRSLAPFGAEHLLDPTRQLGLLEHKVQRGEVSAEWAVERREVLRRGDPEAGIAGGACAGDEAGNFWLFDSSTGAPPPSGTRRSTPTEPVRRAAGKPSPPKPAATETSVQKRKPRRQ